MAFQGRKASQAGSCNKSGLTSQSSEVVAIESAVYNHEHNI
jgi:hypothetical protein